MLAACIPELAELLGALRAANNPRCQPPLSEAEVVAVVDSLLRYDPASPLLVVNLNDSSSIRRPPQFKIWLAANHKPSIRGSDHGIWRRIRLVPFTITIPEPEWDPRLTLKLAEELSGILAWAVRCCLAWREQGLDVPDEVKAATATYREAMDIFGGFLDEGCVPEPGALVTGQGAVRLRPAVVRRQRREGAIPEGPGDGAQGAGARGLQGFRGVRCRRGLRHRRVGEVAEAAGVTDGRGPV